MSTPTSDRGGVIQTIRALRASGHTLVYVSDGEDDVPVTNEREALDAIFAVDEAYLYVTLPNRESRGWGWVRFVLGNSPEEVVCDYTTNLHVLDELTKGWL